MIRELRHIIPEVSKTIIHEAVTEKLGYRKLCARWVPKMLTDDHKTKWMGSVLKFLMRYAQEDEFLDSIVTGDATWDFHHTPKSKQQSLQWHHTHSRMTERTSHWRNFGTALPFQTRLTQTKPVLPLPNEHCSQVKGQDRRQCCHITHKKIPYRPTRDVSLLSGQKIRKYKPNKICHTYFDTVLKK
jgi:hypothetical protein